MEKQQRNVLKTNKKTLFNYEIKAEKEAGIVLEGWEVKAIKKKQFEFSASYVVFNGGEAFLENFFISSANVTTKETKQHKRYKLLLHTNEIFRFQQLKVKKKGLTIVPYQVYFSERRKIKVLLVIGLGKKQHDKKRTIKERDELRARRHEIY